MPNRLKNIMPQPIVIPPIYHYKREVHVIRTLAHAVKLVAITDAPVHIEGLDPRDRSLKFVVNHDESIADAYERLQRFLGFEPVYDEPIFDPYVTDEGGESGSA